MIFVLLLCNRRWDSQKRGSHANVVKFISFFFFCLPRSGVVCFFLHIDNNTELFDKHYRYIYKFVSCPWLRNEKLSSAKTSSLGMERSFFLLRIWMIEVFVYQQGNNWKRLVNDLLKVCVIRQTIEFRWKV